MTERVAADAGMRAADAAALENVAARRRLTQSGPAARFWRSQSWHVGLLILIAVLTVSTWLYAPRFLSPFNVATVLASNTYIGIAAIGMTMLIIIRQIDVSVGAIIGVAAIVAGLLAKAGYPLWISWTAPILVGVVLSSINGVITTFGRVPSIVVTLGMLSILRGGTASITNGAFITNLPPDYMIAHLKLWGINFSFILLVVLTGITAWWMRYTRFGRSIYAVGSNPAAARAIGIDERFVTLAVFAIHGAFAGLAGVLYGTQTQTLAQVVPANVELGVIAAAVIGGVSIAGGVGSVVGATLATLLFAALASALIFLSVSAFWLKAFQGGLILATLLFEYLRRKD